MGGWLGGGLQVAGGGDGGEGRYDMQHHGCGPACGDGGGGHGRVGAKVGEGRGRGLGRGVVGDKGEGVAEGSHGLLVLRASLGRGR